MAKKAPETKAATDPITVYSFAGSIIVPTEQGSYWATAIGGVVESRPVGAPVLYSLMYIWDMAGSVFALPEPVRIRVNTIMAVTMVDDFKFPEPEAAPEPVADLRPPTPEDVDILRDEDEMDAGPDEEDLAEVPDDQWETELQDA